MEEGEASYMRSWGRRIFQADATADAKAVRWLRLYVFEELKEGQCDWSLTRVGRVVVDDVR